MSAARFLADENAFWTNAGVFVPLLFLVIFSVWHRWWRDPYGRCLGLLAMALICARLMNAMHDWGLHATWARWVSVTALGLGPVVFAVLCCKLAQPHLPWVKRRRDALEELIREEDCWRVGPH